MLFRADASAPESPFNRVPTSCNPVPVAKLGFLQAQGMPKLMSASLSSPELKVQVPCLHILQNVSAIHPGCHHSTLVPM